MPFRDMKSWDMVRTALVATFVALLVWIWAEAESVSRKRISILVSLDADPRSEMVYRPEDAEWTRAGNIWTRAVTIEVEGAPSGIADAEALARSDLLLSFGQEGMPREPGPAKLVDLARAIPALNDFRRINVVIASVDPPFVPVEVRRMVQRELPVKVELARPMQLDGEPSASPSTVTIRLPDTLADKLTDGLQPVALVSAEELDRVRGDTRTVNGLVRLPASLGPVDSSQIDIRPEVVSVSLRVRREVDSFRLPAVPVWFSLPPTEDGAKWTIDVLDSFVNDVTVSGPADLVSRIRSGEVVIKALIELATDDLNKTVQPDRTRPPTDTAPLPPDSGTITRPVLFLGLPPGVTATAANPLVRVRIVRAATPTSSADPTP